MLLRAVLTLCLLDLMTGGWGCNAEHTSKIMKADIDKLWNHYKIPKAQLFDGNPVFPKETFHNNFEDSERRVLTSVVLEVYLNLFSQMLNQTEDQVLRESLVNVQKKVQELQKHYYQGNLPELKKQMKNLWAIKTTDNLVQGKAVSQLRTIYEDASELAKRIHQKNTNRRKRRQTMRRQATLV